MPARLLLLAAGVVVSIVLFSWSMAEATAATIEISSTPNPPVPLLEPVEFATSGIEKGIKEPLIEVKEYEQPAGVCGELVWDHTSAIFTYYNLGEGWTTNREGRSCFETRADYDLWVTLFYNSRKLGRVVLAEREFETTDVVP